MHIEGISSYSEEIPKNEKLTKETTPLATKEIKKLSLDELIIESIKYSTGDDLEGLVKKFNSTEDKAELTAKIKEGLADFIKQGRHLKHYSFGGLVKDMKEYDNARIRTEFLKSIGMIDDEAVNKIMKIIETKEENFQNQI